RDVQRTGQMSLLPLTFATDVHDLDVLVFQPGSQFFGADSLNGLQLPACRAPALEHLAAEIPGDPCQPDQSENLHRLVDAVAAAGLDQEVEFARVRNEPTGPGGERLGEGNVDGARDVT